MFEVLSKAQARQKLVVITVVIHNGVAGALLSARIHPSRIPEFEKSANV
jgi:hypothetical protein